MSVTPPFAAVAFDIIETVFSLESLRKRLTATGLSGEVLEQWFAQTLRDAFALEVTGVYRSFREVASDTLAGLLVGHGLPADEPALAGVLDGFAALSPHPDAATAFQRLHEAGIPVIALTNGSAEATGKLLQTAGLPVTLTIGSEEVGHWKPARAVYLHAAERLGIAPGQLVLVAAHPWDIHGAGCAGLLSAYVRRGKPYPAGMKPPRIEGGSLEEVAQALVRLHASAASGA